MVSEQFTLHADRYLQFFFFQAEDGIRDLTVTGVQTCALPISCAPGGFRRVRSRNPPGAHGQGVAHRFESPRDRRSEERRVGKECRSRWLPHPQKKNKGG